MFDPDLEKDRTTTISEYGKGAAKKTIELGTVMVTKISLRTPSSEVKEYLLGPEDHALQVVSFYDATDRALRAPQGTIQIVPKSEKHPNGFGAIKFYSEAERELFKAKAVTKVKE